MASSYYGSAWIGFVAKRGGVCEAVGDYREDASEAH
jgi:hypothetical protein